MQQLFYCLMNDDDCDLFSTFGTLYSFRSASPYEVTSQQEKEEVAKTFDESAFGGGNGTGEDLQEAMVQEICSRQCNGTGEDLTGEVSRFSATPPRALYTLHIAHRTSCCTLHIA